MSSVLGVLDNDTISLMSTPRCGVKDKIGHSESARRKKRYALQGKESYFLFLNIN